MKDATIVDIARLAGVSVSTVSRVLNNHPDVKEATRQKVQQVIQQNIYIPNNSARNLKRENMKAIAVVVKGFSNPFFTAMLTIIQKELDNNRYLMLLHQVEPQNDEVEAAIALCKEKKPRGLIFMGGNFKHARGRLEMLEVPYVMLTMPVQDGDVDKDSFSSVTIDDYAAGYGIAKRMIDAGHTQLAAIGFSQDDISISRLRIDGFRQALRDNGLYDKDEQIAYTREFTRKAGYNAVQQLLQKTHFSCLFCISDILALGAIRALYEAGLAIPRDVSAVGFDGIEEGLYAIPSLATVQQPAAEMAHKALRILLNHIRGGAPHRHMVFETSFREGESFAPFTGTA